MTWQQSMPQLHIYPMSLPTTALVNPAHQSHYAKPRNTQIVADGTSALCNDYKLEANLGNTCSLTSMNSSCVPLLALSHGLEFHLLRHEFMAGTEWEDGLVNQVQQ